jgi:phospholipid/cholesterol/gamma-HCH transport system substrate-binding protein
VARNLHMGDYTNLSVQLDLNLDGALPTGLPTTLPTGLPTLPTSLPTLPTSLPTSLPTVIDPTAVLNDVLKCLQSGDLNSDACLKVLSKPADLLKLRQECQKPENQDKNVCKQLALLPSSSPTVPLPTLTSILPSISLPTLLPRAGLDERPLRFGARGPTMRQLTRLYDPALVELLVPGMVMSR